ncbi:amino acid adenylation domain-containing protein [Kitasatospora sp. NPDC058162]|uniref:amino acid adenylation domain-containing protein n=1 Tax=Kitasatospora sp. NPDC058162 TaxID=3346362 RepID=UPI0036DAFB54
MSDLQARIAALPADKRARLEEQLKLRSTPGRAPDPITPRADRDAPVPLSWTQQRAWILSQLGSPYNPPCVIEVDGVLDLAALRDTFTDVLARHEALRTVIEAHEGTARQRVLPPAPVPMPVRDLGGLPPEEQERIVAELARAESRRGFDLGRDQMLRVVLVRLGEQRHLLLLTIHHIAMDAWAIGVLVREVGALYAARSAGQPSPLHELPIQYADFALWQREHLQGERLAEQLDHWRAHLGDPPPPLVLPTDFTPPDGPGADGATHEVALPEELATRIKELADREGATVFMTMLAAFAALLHRWTGQQELVLGSTIANRTPPETEALIACFVNTVALRADVSGDLPFDRLLARVKEAVLGGFEHQELPFEKLVQELAGERDPAQLPIVRAVLNYDNTTRRPLEYAGLRLAVRPVPQDVVHFDLVVTITPADGGLLATWEYNTDLFTGETVARLAAGWRSVLEQVTERPRAAVDELRILAAADRHRLEAWNDTAVPVPDTTVHRLFEERAAATPDAEAVVLGTEALSYAELNARADLLAAELRALGVRPGVLVGILVDRSFALPEAVLAVLKAGGAYVPLDPDYPADRVAFMLQDAAVGVLVTTSALREQLAGQVLPALAADGRGAPRLLVLDVERPRPEADPAGPRPDEADPTDLAYVIYTSGSTGRPKGALTEHRALVNYALGAVEAFGLTATDRVLQFASPGFDVLVEELFPTWLAGATLVMVPERVLGGGELVRLIETQRLTAFELPTSLWHEWVHTLAEERTVLPPSLRLVIVGGERILPDRLRAWRRTGVELVHVFGLTETTVTTTAYRVPPLAAGPDGAPADTPDDGLDERLAQNLPIGRPWPNMTVHVLDARQRPVPPGVPGELYIGGASVARGYLNRPELTEQRFLPDPFGPATARLYRTGDLVRRLDTGDLQFLGRLDTQVKVRGHRIEPAEIEAALARHPDVRDVAVVAREDTPGDRRLVAYLVPPAGREPGTGELRRFLEDALPAPLVPSAFVLLDALPTTAHGKLDRAALPAPDGARPQLTEEFTAPAEGIEQTLARIWAEVIGVDRVGVHDNFFEIGGDSILSIQIAARAQAAGLRIGAMDVFRHPTIHQLAPTVGTGDPDTGDLTPVSGPTPLLPLQQWFFDRRLPAPQHWNMAVLLELRRPYGEDLLRQALDRLLEHHDGLRQRFAADDGPHGPGPGRSWIADPDRGEPGRGVPLEVHDLSAVPAGRRAEELADLAGAVQRGLDLAVGPLVRAALFRLGGAEPPRLLVAAHHLVVDAVSWRILLEDFAAICEALRTGAPVRLPPKTTSVPDWARRLEEYAGSAALTAQAGHWRELLDTAPDPLPVDFDRARGEDTVALAATHATELDAERTEALLREAPAAYRTRIDELLLTALARALHRWTGAAAHLVELEGHGRQSTLPGVDLARTVGWFTAVHPVALEVRAGEGPEELIKRVKERLRSVPDAGLGHTVLRQRGALADRPAAEIAFSYFGQFDQLVQPDAPLAPAAEGTGAAADPRGRRPHLLEVAAQIRDGRLQVSWTYGQRVHRATTVERLARDYLDELTALIEHCRGARGGFTPSDFPQSRLSQSALDAFMSRLASRPEEDR